MKKLNVTLLIDEEKLRLMKQIWMILLKLFLWRWNSFVIAVSAWKAGNVLIGILTN